MGYAYVFGNQYVTQTYILKHHPPVFFFNYKNIFRLFF